MQEKIFFYHTNDLHSDFTYWSRVVSYLKGEAVKREQNNETYWIADIGDHVDRVNPIAEAFMGKANVDLMNEAGYNMATLGNNEGITLSHEDLHGLYDEADFQVVCANLHSKRKTPGWLETTAQFQSEHGVTVGVIGLTAPFNDFYKLLDWHVSPPVDALRKHIDVLKKTSDVIVLLSHLGMNEDREIARMFPEIDVIMGGHTHHLLRTGEEINQTMLTAAGKNCAFVGEVILTWDHNLKKLINTEAYTTDITHLDKDLPTEELLTDLYRQADDLLSETVVYLNHAIDVEWFSHNDLVQQLAHTAKEWTNADCAMVNTGLLLDRIPQGNITYREIHAICPHPINLCVVELQGIELLEVIRAVSTPEFMEFKLKGLGFRGKLIGRMIYSGIDILTESLEGGQDFVKDVYVGGAVLDPKKTYTVALPDMFTFGRLLPEAAKSEMKKYFLPEFVRDLLVKTLKNKY